MQANKQGAESQEGEEKERKHMRVCVCAHTHTNSIAIRCSHLQRVERVLLPWDLQQQTSSTAKRGLNKPDL